MIDNPQHALDLGDFALVDGEGESGWKSSVHASDASFGESLPVLVGVRSLLRDGMSLRVQSHENREAYFLVEISGPDLAAVGDGEAALMAELYRRNTLTWTPPDGYGAVTVFEVVTSRMSAPLDDMNELMLKRVFGITLTCLPFSRSVDPTVIGSEFVSSDVVIADDCESTTGWAAATGASSNLYPPAFSVDSTAGNFVTGTGSVKVSAASGVPVGYGSSYLTAFTAFGIPLSIDASGGGYVVCAVRGEWIFSIYEAHITTSGGGREKVASISQQAIGDGFVSYALAVPDASTVTLLELEVWQNLNVNPGEQPPLPDIWVDSIGLADASTDSQQVRSMEIGGSARTEGQIAISAAVGLGDVVLYTARDLDDGFRPDVRRWQTVGTDVADSDALNGSHLALSGAASVFEYPAGSLRPGAYAVLARVKSALGDVGVSVAAQTVIGSTAVGGVESESGSLDVGAVADFVVMRVGVLHLPPTLVEATATDAVVRFSVTSEIAGTKLDELMVFPMADAALTWVECGDGSPSATVSSRLWVDGPTLEKPRGQILVGNDENRMDARAVRPLARGSHMLYPGKMLAYLLTSAAGGAAMSVTYYKAWHTHAGS